jgi:hypothetical protein
LTNQIGIKTFARARIGDAQGDARPALVAGYDCPGLGV